MRSAPRGRWSVVSSYRPPSDGLSAQIEQSSPRSDAQPAHRTHGRGHVDRTAQSSGGQEPPPMPPRIGRGPKKSDEGERPWTGCVSLMEQVQGHPRPSPTRHMADLGRQAENIGQYPNVITENRRPSNKPLALNARHRGRPRRVAAGASPWSPTRYASWPRNHETHKKSARPSAPSSRGRARTWTTSPSRSRPSRRPRPLPGPRARPCGRS
jgi:hypothetical protein